MRRSTSGAGRLLLAAATLLTVLAMLPASAAALTSLETLGKKIYWDAALSTPNGQSCGSCHDPSAGWADPYRSLPVSRGVVPGLFGGRNAPPAAYAKFSPSFQWNSMKGVYAGGQFWDGRANDLVAQAMGPFLNPVEMANPDKAAVVNDIRSGPYANLFKQVFGRTVFGNVDTAYLDAAKAIAAYESSSEVNRFSSKYDAVMAGRATFTSQEQQGLMLFRCKGGCSSCHTVGGMGGAGMGGGCGGGGMGGAGMGGSCGGGMGGGMANAVFTDFSYRNVGAPYNAEYAQAPLAFPYAPDLGLGGRAGYAGQAGTFKVPSLRNVALSGPYAHNGYFKTLRDIVDFYNTRDVDPTWPDPEVGVNVSPLLGNLGLTSAEVDAVVAFLKTLSDGYYTP